ncbi:MAG: FIST C-terminal domain-containing protein [Planctomycetes bacterium]|nr:FIST C-terminal domain-containing protein [Planctomycetota bacterium]
MIHAATALVREIPDGHAAAAAAVQHAGQRLGERPGAAVVFGTPHFRADADAILATFREAGCAAVLGGCASGVMTEEGEAEAGPALAALLLSGLELRPFLAPPDALRGALPPGDPVMVLPDPGKIDLAAMMKEFDEAGEFRPLIGGALSGGSGEAGHYQFAGDHVETGSVAGASIAGGSFAIGVAHGCRPIGRPLVITRCEGHIVMALAGRAPLEVLREALEAHAKAEGGPGGPVLAGIAVDSTKSPLKRGDFIVRNLVAVQTEQGAVLAVGTPVRVGQTLVFHLMDREGAVADMKEMVGGVAAELGGPPAFGMYFNCRGRGKFLYGETDHDVLAIRTGLGGFPFIGFFGNAEFAPIARRNWLHNYTGVLLAVR